MTSDELKKAVSTVLEQPHHTQLYLVLKINNELVLRLADVEDEKTAPEIQRLFEEFLTAAISTRSGKETRTTRTSSVGSSISSSGRYICMMTGSPWF